MSNDVKALGFSLRCIQETCYPTPITPTQGGKLPSQMEIIWNWNAVNGAIGYKWNTTNDYSSGTDMGSATSKTETGLVCNTSHTRYAWAYNSCGFSSPVSLMQSTTACSSGFTCGQTLIINHIAGEVAPVNKTTTYGTVTGIPGEPTKCWIISNLGPDHQATAVNDASEASAGWYWQFNRKQGFQHDGSMRIPNTEWINLSPGLTDWQTANDPCTLELGSLWRLPTYSEWDNVDITGGWNTWYDIWASGLKLHASGRLYYTDGNVTERGGLGCYWSSAQSYWQWRGWHLYFHSGYSAMNDYWDKTYGFSVRCLRE